MTTRTLAWLAAQAQGGAPLRALFIANEYLDRDDRLRKALCSKAELSCLSRGIPAELWTAAREGKVVSELEPETRQALAELGEKAPSRPARPALSRRLFFSHLNARRTALVRPAAAAGCAFGGGMRKRMESRGLANFSLSSLSCR